MRRIISRGGHEAVAVQGLADVTAELEREMFAGLLLAPGADWAVAIAWLKEGGWAARLPIVLVARSCDAQYLLDAVVAGARSAVLESDAPEKILLALETAVRPAHRKNLESDGSNASSTEIPATTTEVLAGLMSGRLRFCAEARDGADLQLVLQEIHGAKPLRSLERRALDMLLAGDPLKVIASDLDMVVSSVWSLVDAARAKMGFRSRIELITVLSALQS
ncbi:MAG: hypothetical protein JNK04_10935 [Myxococcales bacterium]|nr:hypothetical protein [Myxococcales bacterium]